MRIVTSLCLVLGGCGSPGASNDGGADGAGQDAVDASVCATALECLPGETDQIVVCGVLLDAADGSEVAGDIIDIVAYDPLELGASPQDAEPVGSSTPDDCGGFRLVLPWDAFPSSFVAVVAERPAAYVRSSVSVAVPTSRTTGVVALAVRTETDVAWSDCAFGAAASPFSERGTVLLILEHEGAPLSGVTVTGASAPDLLYLTGDTASERACAEESGPTGANGSVLLTNGGHSIGMTGGEPLDCSWDTGLLTGPITGLYSTMRFRPTCP